MRVNGLAKGPDFRDPELLSLPPQYSYLIASLLFCADTFYTIVRCPICRKNKCKSFMPLLPPLRSYMFNLFSFLLLKSSEKLTVLLEQYSTIASAVIVPHDEDVDASPPGRLIKRRQSTLSPESTKRARLNHNDHSSSSSSNVKYGDGDRGELHPETGAAAAGVDAEGKANIKAESDDESSRPSRRPPGKAAGKEEERKRGKRLFGALLGTIGKFQQDSSSARARNSAVKRREVEAKLQEKLKQQTDEIDERRKKEDQNINLRRRMEQREFDERAVGIFCLGD